MVHRGNQGEVEGDMDGSLRGRRWQAAGMVLLLALTAAGTVLLAGAKVHAHVPSASPRLTLHVMLKDYRVLLDRHRIPAGVPIRFVVTNTGRRVHELVVEHPHDMDMAIVDGEETYEIDNVKPGEMRSGVWTIPNRGTWRLACHRPGHYHRGMFTLLYAG